MKLKLFSVLIILFVSCKTDNHDKSILHKINGAGKITKKHTIAMLPFKGVDSVFIETLKQKIQNKVTLEIFIIKSTSLPDYACYKPRQRYIADSLLAFLASVNNKKYEKIIGVTAKDISTRKDEIENWGILGLGSCHGEACVISTFRAGKNKVSNTIFLSRMTTLALHELGHTYGLEHCTGTTCLMKDAEGKMNLDNGDSYCKKSEYYFRNKGISK